MILISIVVPCYKQAHFLDDCLTSVLQQSHTEWECIVVNDGSPDNTAEVAEKWCKRDTRFRLLNKENGGLSSARNAGIRDSSAEFIVALDSDDKLDPKHLEHCLKHLLANPAAGAVTPYVRSFGISTYEWKPTGGDLVTFLSSNQAIGAGSMFYRRIYDEIGGYDETERRGFEDWDFWIRLTAKGYLVDVVPEFLLLYRRTGGSMLDNASGNFASIYRYYFDKHKALYEKHLFDVLCKRNEQVRNLNDQLIYFERLNRNFEKSFLFRALRYFLFKTGKI